MSESMTKKKDPSELKKPGPKRQADRPYLLIVDQEFVVGEEWSSVPRLKKEQCTGEAEELFAAIKKHKPRGIVVQVNFRNEPEVCFGLAVGAMVRKDPLGAPPILFISTLTEEDLPKGGNLAKYTTLLHNRGSSFTQVTAPLDRSAIFGMFTRIPELSEEAWRDLQINYMDDRGRIHTLVVHDLKDSNAQVKVRAKQQLLDLFEFWGKKPIAEKAIADAEAILATPEGKAEYTTKVVGIVQELQKIADTVTPSAVVGVDESKPLDGCNILFVEDDEHFAKTWIKRWSDLGALVTPESNGQAAYARLKEKHDHSALITDWRLKDANGHPQVEKQGFELLKACDDRINVRISLTNLSNATISGVGNTLLRDGLPDYRVYRKEDLAIDAIHELLIQDLRTAARWSQATIIKKLEKRGLGVGQWTLWREYFKVEELQDSKYQQLVKYVDTEATKWWSAIKTSLTKQISEWKPAPLKEGAKGPSGIHMGQLKLAVSETFAAHGGGESPTLERLLVTRRVVLALLAWLLKRDAEWTDKTPDRTISFLSVDQLIEHHVRRMLNPAADAKSFKNLLNIATGHFTTGKGLLKEECNWLQKQSLTISFKQRFSKRTDITIANPSVG